MFKHAAMDVIPSKGVMCLRVDGVNELFTPEGALAIPNFLSFSDYHNYSAIFIQELWFYPLLIQYIDNESLVYLLGIFKALCLQATFDPMHFLFIHKHGLTRYFIKLIHKEIKLKRCRKFLQFNHKYYTFDINQSILTSYFSGKIQPANILAFITEKYGLSVRCIRSSTRGNL